MSMKASIIRRLHTQLANAASLAVLAGAAVGFTVSAYATPAVNLTSPPSIGGVDGSHFAVGYRFRVNTDLLVTALGAYDYGLDGIVGGATVGLYTLDGVLLASASVPDGTSGSFLDGYFRYVDIIDVPLFAGTEYVLGSYSEDPNGFFNQNYGGVKLTTDPAVTLLRNRDKAGVDELTFPDREPSNAHLGSFGPNMQIAQVSELPEPASLALLLAGLGAMAASLRPRRGS